MLVRTSKLKGIPLDWFVAMAAGYGTNCGNQVDIRIDVNGAASCLSIPVNGEYRVWKPSSDWADGGPIIEREKIRLDPRDGEWLADTWDQESMEFMTSYGPTPLIAAMRAFVKSKLGEEVAITSNAISKTFSLIST